MVIDLFIAVLNFQRLYGAQAAALAVFYALIIGWDIEARKRQAPSSAATRFERSQQ